MQYNLWCAPQTLEWNKKRKDGREKIPLNFLSTKNQYKSDPFIPNWFQFDKELSWMSFSMHYSKSLMSLCAVLVLSSSPNTKMNSKHSNICWLWQLCQSVCALRVIIITIKNCQYMLECLNTLRNNFLLQNPITVVSKPNKWNEWISLFAFTV